MSDSSLIAERLPVWEALSEFFLDTELDDDDHQRIAKMLSSSPYSLRQIEDILKHEVYPALIWNLRSIAGEWAGFDQDWLIHQIKPNLNKRPIIRWPLLQWCMIRDHWTQVSRMIRSDRHH